MKLKLPKPAVVHERPAFERSSPRAKHHMAPKRKGKGRAGAAATPGVDDRLLESQRERKQQKLNTTAAAAVDDTTAPPPLWNAGPPPPAAIRFSTGQAMAVPTDPPWASEKGGAFAGRYPDAPAGAVASDHWECFRLAGSTRIAFDLPARTADDAAAARASLTDRMRRPVRPPTAKHKKTKKPLLWTPQVVDF